MLKPQLTPQSISNVAQNKPCQIAWDLLKAAGVPPHITYTTLLRRGVFKWLANRRHLIKLKDRMRRQERDLLEALYACKRMGRRRYLGRDRLYWRGYLAALRVCRREMRAIFHSPRWQVQDNDTHAQRFLVELMAHNYAIEHGLYKKEGAKK